MCNADLLSFVWISFVSELKLSCQNPYWMNYVFKKIRQYHFRLIFSFPFVDLQDAHTQALGNNILDGRPRKELHKLA